MNVVERCWGIFEKTLLNVVEMLLKKRCEALLGIFEKTLT